MTQGRYYMSGLFRN